MICHSNITDFFDLQFHTPILSWFRYSDSFYALKVDESQLLEEHTNAKKAIAEWFGAVQEYKADVAA